MSEANDQRQMFIIIKKQEISSPSKKCRPIPSFVMETKQESTKASVIERKNVLEKVTALKLSVGCIFEATKRQQARLHQRRSH